MCALRFGLMHWTAASGTTPYYTEPGESLTRTAGILASLPAGASTCTDTVFASSSEVFLECGALGRFDAERAHGTVAFVERHFRVRGNAGY